MRVRRTGLSKTVLALLYLACRCVLSVDIEVVLCHLLTQAALFKHVIDHATLGEIGFCCFYRCIFFNFFAVFSNKIVIYF